MYLETIILHYMTGGKNQVRLINPILEGYILMVKIFCSNAMAYFCNKIST